MPYTPCEKKIYSSLLKQYGKKKGESVYHAMKNSGRIDKICKKAAQNKKKK